MSMPLRSCLLAVAAIAMSSANASAAVIYSGQRNLPVPADPVGLYLNVVTGAYETPVPFHFPSAALENWDINLGGSGLRFFTTPNNARQTPMGVAASQKGIVISSFDQAANLAPGATIGPASNFQVDGPAADNLSTGQPAIFGFRFRNESTAPTLTTHYGWARVILTDGAPGVLVDYAYESVPDTAIRAAATPEPTTAAALLGAAGIVARRRRRR